ncbi:hypothetical protein [Mucilaginibacter myungsuensis]|uniref:Uncharacterized protein n=1 Tax=Mucilaginibacter myungsuensis TaxID=649104 RepID=A0A929PWF2_9SPHI|nr:hypothetical protein [Mucilaginibacter myungsuensis]MBE9662016.1 hypothetical protein [Mucilaginibacter myungsuensis]MDN3599551.1 hypothetical protein [Mucilaginibacter myungsuensis]
MAIIAEIFKVDNSVSDAGMNDIYTATFYIRIRDAATGLDTPGNGVSITYQKIINGVPDSIHTRTVSGWLDKLETSTFLILRKDGTATYTYDLQIVASDPIQPDEPPIDPGACDLLIYEVAINKKESAPGAADGQISIAAGSSKQPMSYSLDGTNFQSSPIFNGIPGGNYTTYVSDAIGCTVTHAFTLPTLQSMLVDDPSVSIGSGNNSRWNAAFNPVVFTYQRRDFEVTEVIRDGNDQAILIVNRNVSDLPAGELVYVDAGPYKGVFETKVAAGNQLPIKASFIETASGFININRYRPYYCIKTKVTYINRETGREQTIEATHRPDGKGLVRADISSFLQSLLQVQDDSDYTKLNFKDTNLSASYKISYAEQWDGIANPVYHHIAQPYYIVYAAKQLGDAHGGNLAAYVPFPMVDDDAKLAKWLTDFAEPAYSNGYPFDIGFIYSDAIAGLDIYAELILLDINRQPITGTLQNNHLLNEDGSFLLQQDGSKWVIAYASVSGQGLSKCIGLNRLLVNQNFPAAAHYFSLTLKYDDDSTPRPVTRTQTVRIDKAVDDNSVYLRWIGLTGSWNYYRFVYDQEISLDVQNAVIIKNYVTDWANQQSIEEVISKSAGVKMKVMAEDLSVADIKGLQSIKYSPKVQLLVSMSPMKWQTVVLNTATFAEYQTKNGQAPFSVTFNLPGINVQSQ